MEGLLIIFIIAMVIAIVWGIFNGRKKTRLYEAYQKALKGNDKMKALIAGREYYKALYGKNYDSVTVEAKLNNEISTIQTHINDYNNDKLQKLVKCPFCAEDIKKEAVICRFCGKNLQTNNEYKNSNYTVPIDYNNLNSNNKNMIDNNKSNQNIYNLKYIAIDSIEMKRIPDSSCETLINLSKGDIVLFLNYAIEDTKANSMWYKIKINDIEGWCYNNKLKIYNE